MQAKAIALQGRSGPSVPPMRQKGVQEKHMWIVKLALNRPYTFIVLALLILIAAPVVILRAAGEPARPIMIRTYISRWAAFAFAGGVCFAIAGCRVGPEYVRPSAPPRRSSK